MIPERDIQPLGLSVQDGLRLVISGGMATPLSPRGTLSQTRDGASPARDETPA
jgi:uncharacterized membrane protein